MLWMVGGDERDGLAPIPHDVEREHWLVRDLEAVQLLARHVEVREHRDHAGHRESLDRIDREDARVWMRAAHRRTPEHPFSGEVG